MTDAAMQTMVVGVFAEIIGSWAVAFGVIAIVDFFADVAGDR